MRAASSSPLPADDSFDLTILQAPVQYSLHLARVLVKFSRPHTLLGTLVSVNSVSLLGLVRASDQSYCTVHCNTGLEWLGV